MILDFITTCHDYYDFKNTLQLYYDLHFLIIIKMMYDFLLWWYQELVLLQ